MKHTIIKLVIIAFALLLVAPVLAQDEPKPTGGEGDTDVNIQVAAMEQVVMAVADGVPSGSADAQLGKDIADVLRRDFKISGYFEVLPTDGLLPGLTEEGVAAAETSFDQWYSSGAEALVKFSVKGDGDKLDLDFKLYDTIKAKEIPLQYDEPAASKDSYRAAAHAFANAVIKYYSGQEGIFGQTLLVTRKGKGQAHVYKVGTDGAGLSKVSSGKGINLLPAWGPSGQVLYTSYDKGNPDLMLGDTVISSRSGLNTGADYCGGNGKIALTLSKDENPEIYTISADGTGLTRLTNNGYIDTSPSWSPDCSQMAFVSNRGGSPQIWVMNADGSGASQVTTAGKYNTSPSWGPKGDKIAFTARDEYNVFDIFVVDADSGYMERLTQDQGNNEEPTWSPDGNYLAFTSTRDGGSKLYIMTADGRFQTAITEGSGYETPAWGR